MSANLQIVVALQTFGIVILLIALDFLDLTVAAMLRVVDARIIIRVAATLEVDFGPLFILTAIVSNASGLLTLVGDPVTFILAVRSSSIW